MLPNTPEWIDYKLLMNLGGETLGGQFSLISPSKSKCQLSLPQLPAEFIIDPLVAILDENILVCHIDYDRKGVAI